MLVGVRAWAPGGELVIDNTVESPEPVEPASVVPWLCLLHGTQRTATIERILVVADYSEEERLRPPAAPLSEGAA